MGLIVSCEMKETKCNLEKKYPGRSCTVFTVFEISTFCILSHFFYKFNTPTYFFLPVNDKLPFKNCLSPLISYRILYSQ